MLSISKPLPTIQKVQSIINALVVNHLQTETAHRNSLMHSRLVDCSVTVYINHLKIVVCNRESAITSELLKISAETKGI